MSKKSQERERQREIADGRERHVNIRMRPSEPIAKVEWSVVPDGKMKAALEHLRTQYPSGFLVSHGSEYAWICDPGEGEFPTMFSVNEEAMVDIRAMTGIPYS